MSDNDNGTHPALIRIVAVHLPGILLELVKRQIDQQPDMRLDAYVPDYLNLLTIVKPDTDVVLLGLNEDHAAFSRVRHVDALPAICSQMFDQFPRLRLILLTSTGNKAVKYWLDLRSQQQEISSPERLLALIRQAQVQNDI